MITLLKLHKVASKAFPGTKLSASHLLFVWAGEEKSELSRILADTGLDVKGLKEALQPLLEKPVEEDRKIINDCILSVSEDSVTGWHLLNILRNRPDHRITRALVKKGMDLKKLRTNLDDNPPQSLFTTLRNKASKKNPLSSYGRDLIEEAATGTFDDLCDRPMEKKNLLRTLLRKQKANPVLTGPAGVGKTALVELLARDLVSKEVPERLVGTGLFELSMGKLVAGTKYRGEFEKRFDTVMKNLKKAEPAILFIDEFHLIWGAGRAEGAPMDAANMLKPLLNRGEFRIIGATTSEEYHRYIERDAALARRFEELRMEEPDEELLLNMVKKQREGLEKYHKITISDEVLSRAIQLTDLHLPNRHQPDKTINLLDSSAVNAVSRKATKLTEDDLLQTLEGQTGRSLSSLNQRERLSLLELNQKLKGRIIGQEEAIEKLSSTLIYRRQHLGEAERNLGSFLFIGNTGVGKTELARSVAPAFFGSEEDLLHLDMSEYSNYGAVNKLVGSSHAIYGNEEGVLTGWLYSKGSGVLLFDEIEKADREIHHLLLGMLDRGRIRDARGEELDTRQCVIILTSNALKPQALRKEPIGFSKDKDRNELAQLLTDHFPHEFLGRLDEIILFNDLGDKQLKQIVKMHLEKGLSRFEQKGVSIKYDEKRLLEYLLRGLKEAKGSGARGVKRLLERMFLQPLAVKLAGYQGERPPTITIGNDFFSSGRIQISSD